ncbi:MAG: hypothetical protein ACKKL5_01825 [Candidatus Komeilibacteria bacterium]
MSIFFAVNKAIKVVFSRPGYIILAGLAAVFMYLLMLSIHIGPFVSEVLRSPYFSGWLKLKLISQSVFSVDTNYITQWAFYWALLLALLAGINIALLIFNLRQQYKARSATGASAVAIIISLLGVGCASCGSVVLSSIFGLGFTTAALHYIPGGTIGVNGLATILLLFSIWLLARKIVLPDNCDWQPIK